MRLLRRAAVTVLGLFLLAGLPALLTGAPQRALQGTDAVSAATVVLDQPSGAYVVLINRGRHTNEDNLAVWDRFFRGEEIDFLFEDISCVTADSDPSGLELARSFQSRLPENQMRLRTENITLLLSKARWGIYDVILLSREVYDAYGAEGLTGGEDMLVIEAEGV